MPPGPKSGWLLVAGLFVIMAVSSGIGFYCLSVFMNALAVEKGFAVFSISGAIGLVFVVSGLAGLVVARLIERFDPRYVISAGALIGGLALARLGSVDEIWQLYVVFGVYGVGSACVSLIPGTVLITRRFDGTRRSVAMALATQGLSAGGVVITPLAAMLIEARGLGVAMPAIGLVFFLGIAPVAWLTVRSEARIGGASGDPTSLSADGWGHGSAIRSAFFGYLTVAYVLIMLAQVGAIAHQFTLIAARADAAIAAVGVSLLAACSIIGRFVGGWMLTWLPARTLTLGNIVLQTLGLAWLGLAGGAATLLLASALFGV
ncbi:MAG: MFS transporter, partial [Gammaproteobacteria bacterium]